MIVKGRWYLAQTLSYSRQGRTPSSWPIGSTRLVCVLTGFQLSVGPEVNRLSSGPTTSCDCTAFLNNLATTSIYRWDLLLFGDGLGVERSRCESIDSSDTAMLTRDTKTPRLISLQRLSGEWSWKKTLEDITLHECIVLPSQDGAGNERIV